MGPSSHLRRWLRYTVEHPWHIIVPFILLTLLLASRLPELRFRTSIYELAIEDLPETERYRQFKKTFGCEEMILVVVRTGGVFQETTFRALGSLSKALSRIRGVRRTVSLPGIREAMDLTGKWNLREFEKILEPVTFLHGNLLSKDKKTTVVTLILEDAAEREQVIRSVQEVLDRRGGVLDLYQTGMPIISRALSHFTERDFKRLPPLTFLVIAIVLFLFFRGLRGVLIPAGCVLLALCWTFGLLAWTGVPLSMLTMIVPIFLIAVGTAYCMYVLPEYAAALQETSSKKEAAYLCISNIAFASALAVATTTLALGSLLANRIHPIREFALFSCFGMFSMLVVILSLLPAVLALLPQPSGRPPAPSFPFLDHVLSAVVHINTHQQKWTIPAFALIAAMGVAGMSGIRVETNPVAFFKPDSSVARSLRDASRHVAGSFPVNVVIGTGTEDFFQDPRQLVFASRVQERLEALEGVDKTISFLDYLRLVNYATNQYRPRAYRLPEEDFEIRILLNSYKSMLGGDLLRGFVDDSFSHMNILLRTHITSSTGFLDLKSRIEEKLGNLLPESMKGTVTGFGVVISRSSHLLTEGQIKSLLLTLGLVFTVMLLLFMSWKVGLIGVLANLFPIIVNFGIMGWLGIPLSIATSLIASVAIGLAVDDTIHYLVRYNREFKKDLDKDHAMQETISRVGRAMVCTSFTVGLGFSILMFSSFQPTAVFGLMMGITMLSALAGDLILLPSLMRHVELVTLWDMLRLRLGRQPQLGIPLFRGLSASQVYYILMAGALKKLEDAQVLFRKGEVSDSMFVIIEGALEVRHEPPSGSILGEDKTPSRLIRRLTTGDVVGEMGMIRSCQRSATVLASGPVELLQINDRMIKRLQWLYPPTAQKFFFNLMTFICDRLENVTQCYMEESHIDTLTGLYTESYFLDLAMRERARALRFQTPLALCLMDLDNFRGINHLYGRHAGDRILSLFGRLVRRQLRRIDLSCRHTGQRFVILFGQCGEAEARSACERLRNLLEKRTVEVNGNPVYVTASFGLAVMKPERPRTIQELTEQASRALDRAKASGKNRVMMAEEADAAPHGQPTEQTP